MGADASMVKLSLKNPFYKAMGCEDMLQIIRDAWGKIQALMPRHCRLFQFQYVRKKCMAELTLLFLNSSALFLGVLI